MYNNSDDRRRGGYGDRGGSRDGGRDGGGRGDSGGRDGGRGQRRGVPLSELDPALTAVSHKLIGCARDVHMNLGQGYDKAAYFEAMKQELSAMGIPFTVNQPLSVKYKGQSVGTTSADLFIDGKFLVEIASHPGEVDSWQRLQLRAKLKSADLELGLILNFGGRLLKDGLVRVLNPDKIKMLRDGDEPADFVDDHDEPRDATA
jgi:GxxExxY protein